MSTIEAEKVSFPEQKDTFADEKGVELHEEEEVENSPIEAVRIGKQTQTLLILDPPISCSIF